MVIIVRLTAAAEDNEIEAVHTNHDIIGGDSPVQNNNDTLESGSALAGEGEEDNNDMEAGADPDADLSEDSICGIGQNRPRKGAGEDTSPRNSKHNWKATIFYIFIALFFVCGIIGFVEFKKKSHLITSTENKDIDVIDTMQVGTAKSSKRGKNRLNLKCGDTFHGKISLKDDLVCEQVEGGNDGIPNAGITLDGPKAVLNCKGLKITQAVADGAAMGCDALDDYAGNLEEDPTKVQDIKNICGLHFIYGIRLLNGAKAKGCNIEKFLVGAYFGLEAEELHNVTASNNVYGVVAETNATAKITNLILKDNREVGIRASNDGKSIFVGDYVPGGSMELKDITATGNGLLLPVSFYSLPGAGIEVEGSNNTLINAVATGNGVGIFVFNSEKIDLENVKANDNDFAGIFTFNSEKIDIENIEANGNRFFGFYISASKEIDVKNIDANDNVVVNGIGNGIGILIGNSDDISLIDTVSTGNSNHGIFITRSVKIDLESFEGNNNGDSGIVIDFSQDLELSLKESISLNENGFYGLLVVFSRGSITLFGELEANYNDDFGILMDSYAVTFSINDGASLSACGNKDDDDIFIGSVSSSLTVEAGGTCTGSTGGPGTIIPASACGACPPPLI